MDSAVACRVGDVIGHTIREKRWVVESILSIGVMVRRVLRDGKMADWAIPVDCHTLSSMVIFRRSWETELTEVSSLDYMNSDALSGEDKRIIKEALL